MTELSGNAVSLEKTGVTATLRATERTGMSPRRSAVLLGLRLLLGGVLVVAGATKIAAPTLFASLIDDYRLLPPGWSTHLAVSLPWVEVLVGCCLVVGLWTRSSALVAAGMFSVFVGAMAVNVYRGVDVACGCFGAGGDEGSVWVSLLRTTVLSGAALVLLGQRRVSSWSVDHLLWVDGSTVDVAPCIPATRPSDRQTMAGTS